MLRNTLTQLRANAGRVSAAALAIVLGVAFVAAALIFTGTLERSVARATSAPELAADLVVSSKQEGFRTGDVDKVAKVDGVEAAEFRYSDSAETAWTGGSGYSSVFVVAQQPELRWFDLVEGKLPGPGDEVALDSVAAKNAGLRVGSTVTIKPLSISGPGETSLKVTGLVDTGRTLMTGGSTPSLFASPQLMEKLGLQTVGGIDVLVEDGADVTTVRQSITSAMGPGYAVQTGEERAQQQLDQMGPMSAVLNAMLLPFAAIALFVAGFVIVNTFSVLFAQRTRQYALLRCVGATQSQIRRSALFEALVVGVVASTIGTVFGIFAVAVIGWPLGLTDSPLDLGALGIGPLALIVPPLVGVVVTVLAALAPAGRATRVAPLAALRPVVEASAAKRIGRVRLVFALIFFLPGFLLLLAGGVGGALPMAVPGAMLTAVGVLLWTPSLIPVVAKLFGLLFRFAGPTGVLASENAVRNPYRAASTSTALMIGVGLIVLLLTGTSTAQETARERINEQYPVDAMLVSKAGPMPPEIVDRARNIDGVSTFATLRATNLEFDYLNYRVFGIDPGEYREVMRHSGDAVAEGKALMNPADLEFSSLNDGDRITLNGKTGGQVSVQVTGSDLVEDMQIVLAESDLRRLDSQAQVSGIWLRAGDDVDASVFVDRLQSFYLQSSGNPINLTGAAPMRAQMDMVLGVMLAVVSGLLGVAVIIAVVGIANTLGLSVLERGRESGLMRALGLTRGQLRGTLAFEAVLLALVGAAMGTVLGVLFAWSGASALFGQLGISSTLHVPFLQLLLVLVSAVIAGVVASVLPARRAAKTAPAEALADE